MTRIRLKIVYVGRDGAVRRRLSELVEGAPYVITPEVPEASERIGRVTPGSFELLVRDSAEAKRLQEVLIRARSAAARREPVALAVELKPAARSARRASTAKGRPTNDAVPMTLRSLRESLGKTQGELARKASMSQPQLSRVEARADHLISTLRKYVQALGGEIEVIALVDGTRVALRNV
jgi:hypothetical protein